MTRHGKSPWRQVWEICKLRHGPGRLRLDAHHYYGLYGDRRFGCAEKVRFLGRKLQDQFIRQCDAGEWWLVAQDKLVCYGLLAGLGLLIPETRALYHAAGRFAAVPVFAAPEAFAAHLRAEMRYPFFGKPVPGVRSVGVAAVNRYETGSDAMGLIGGKSLAVHGSSRSSSPIARAATCSRRCCGRIPDSPRYADEALHRASARAARAG